LKGAGGRAHGATKFELHGHFDLTLTLEEIPYEQKPQLRDVRESLL